MAYKRYFRNSSISDPYFFDEGPRLPENKPKSIINSSSIETLVIDGYRQGVEITQQKHFDAGLVKIHAGEEGHVLKKSRFGMDKNFRPDPHFEDIDLFNPVAFIRQQEDDSFLYYNLMTFPIISGDNDQIENYWFDGIIEAMPIREVASFFSIEAPFVARSIKAGLMAGNDDTTNATDQVQTVGTFDISENQIPYLDMVDMINGQLPLNGYFEHRKVYLKPFDDKRFVLNVSSNLNDIELQSAVSTMSGSTDNYVPDGKRSATSGWTFDNTQKGTDSIAFGGRLY